MLRERVKGTPLKYWSLDTRSIAVIMPGLPPDFLNGFASASYQIEGGASQDGRGPSVWDEALLHTENGEEACDSYNRWRDDIELLKLYGAKAYRFSISWSRVIPKGGKDDPVNPLGIKYYSSLVSCRSSKMRGATGAESHAD